MTEALLMGREEGGKKREETGWRRNNGDAKGNKMPSGVGPHKSRRVPTFLSWLGGDVARRAVSRHVQSPRRSIR